MRLLCLMILMAGSAAAAGRCWDPSDWTQIYSSAALLIGITEHGDDEGPRRVEFAASDAARIAEYFGAKTGGEVYARIDVLRDREATAANVRQCLDNLASHVTESTKIAIFMSARGVVSDDRREGYILTYDSRIEKLQPSTGFTVSELARRIRSLPTRQVYLLVDLCRLPEEFPKKDNFINRVVIESSPARRILLASKGAQRSQVSGQRKSGAFAFRLADGLNQTLSLAELFEQVRSKVMEDTSKAQEPDRPRDAPVDGCVVCKKKQITFVDDPSSTDRYLLALNGSLVGATALQAAVANAAARQAEDRTRQDVSAAVGSKAFARLIALLEKVPPAMASAQDSIETLRFAAKPGGTPRSAELRPPLVRVALLAEQNAQQLFARYGEGNHFLGDPFQQCSGALPKQFARFERTAREFRLCKEEYQAAADLFEIAAAARDVELLMPSAATAEEARQQAQQTSASIERMGESARICRAQVAISEGRFSDVLAMFQSQPEPTLAEAHNVLGIAHLERAEYVEAENEFRQAIARAPLWAYPRHNLALAFVEHGRYTDAEREYQEAIRRTPVGTRRRGTSACFHGRQVVVAARPYLYYNLGVLLQRLNRLGEAQRQYCLAQESFEQQSQDFDQRSTAARTEEDSSLRDSSLADRLELRRNAAEINLADVHNSLGAVFLARGKELKARREFDTSLRKNRDLAPAVYNLAVLLHRKEPETAFEKLTAITNYMPAAFKAAEWAASSGNRNKAATLYEGILNRPDCQGTGAPECATAREALRLLR